MFQDNGDRSSSNQTLSINVGQLIYTSFQNCGFRMLMTSDTPLYIQRSFVEKIVNTRWDPHSPPHSDFRAGYVYQSVSQIDYTVFGWLYYDGKDEFGRSGIPYFIAHYWLGELNPDRLQIILNCLEKGPKECLERHIKGDENLSSLELTKVLDYSSARPGITLPTQIWQDYQFVFSDNQSIDWFFPQAYPEPFSPKSEPPEQNLDHQFQSKLQETTVDSSEVTVNTKQLEAILQDLVDKTMGIQGAALVSEEGNPIVSVIGLKENTSGIISGTMLYMLKETNRELNWNQFETVTLRGPDSYVMLSFCQEGIYLLIKSDKIPMGMLEGAVNRSITKLQKELNSPSLTTEVQDRPALMPGNNNLVSRVETNTQSDHSTPAKDDSPSPERMQVETSFPLEPEIDEQDDSDLSYRGRPANS